MLIVLLFLALILSILFTIEQTNLQKSYSQISEKPPLVWLINLTLLANFQIMLHLMKSNGCVPLLILLHKNL